MCLNMMMVSFLCHALTCLISNCTLHFEQSIVLYIFTYVWLFIILVDLSAESCRRSRKGLGKWCYDVNLLMQLDILTKFFQKKASWSLFIGIFINLQKGYLYVFLICWVETIKISNYFLFYFVASLQMCLLF